MTTPPQPPRPDEDQHSDGPERSWNPLRRIREAFSHDADEKRLGPADPSGFDWLGREGSGTDPQPGPDPASTPTPDSTPPADSSPTPDSSPAADSSPPADSSPEADSSPPADVPLTTSPDGAMAPKAQVTNGHPDARVTCPTCHAEIDDAAFCEHCGGPLGPAPGRPAPAAHAGLAGRDPDGLLVLGAPPPGGFSGKAPPLPNGGICAECGGTVDPDGYCENCGAKAADPRHHYEVILDALARQGSATAASITRATRTRSPSPAGTPLLVSGRPWWSATGCPRRRIRRRPVRPPSRRPSRY